MTKLTLQFPTWIVALYAFSAVVLLPWTYILAKNLPTRKLAIHWDIAWVGFDIFMLVLIALTAFFAARKSIWLVLSASAVATVLLVDAWFDVLTAKPGKQQTGSVVFAVFIEIPMALLTYALVRRVLVHLNKGSDTLPDVS